MSKRVATTVVLVCLLVCPALLSGQSPAPTTASGLKIGVINMQGAIANTGEGKKAFAELQKKYEPRQKDLQQLQQSIASKQDQLQRQNTTLSDDEQRRLNREVETDQTRLKRMQEDLQADAQADQQEVVNRVGQKMVRLMNDYAQQNGYSIIMDGGPQMALYYVAPQIDLTEIMIKKYDSANPVEGAANALPSTAPSAVVPKTSPVKPPLRPKQ